jgi:hypothetical protein
MLPAAELPSAPNGQLKKTLRGQFYYALWEGEDFFFVALLE